jgi:hypothetical protein
MDERGTAAREQSRRKPRLGGNGPSTRPDDPAPALSMEDEVNERETFDKWMWERKRTRGSYELVWPDARIGWEARAELAAERENEIVIAAAKVGAEHYERDIARDERLQRLSYEITGNDYALVEQSQQEVTESLREYRERAFEEREAACRLQIKTLIARVAIAAEREAAWQAWRGQIADVVHSHEAVKLICELLSSGPQPIPEHERTK